MELVSVTRLYKDRTSHEIIMVLKCKENGQQFRVTLPHWKAEILALEGHGLNDRCPLYQVFSECVSQLGGKFGSIVITLNESNGISCALALTKEEKILSWITGDVAELVAFALHVSLPIYVRLEDTVCKEIPRSGSDVNTLPSVIEEALSDILNSVGRTEHTLSSDDISKED